MNVELLKKTGNIDQLAGIREGVLLRGRGEGMKTAEFYNAAGLRFTVLPDRCMDIYDLSFRGMNLSFHAKNGPVSPVSSGKITEDFEDTWPGGMLVTCGLENINGGYADHDVNCMTHGRISSVQEAQFLTRTCWNGNDFLLEAEGEMNESRMGTGMLGLRRRIETSLYARSVTITDTVTNLTGKEMPYALLYHVNFGFPLLEPGVTTGARGICPTLPACGSVSTHLEIGVIEGTGIPHI